jgi:hypothetical protein
MPSSTRSSPCSVFATSAGPTDRSGGRYTQKFTDSQLVCSGNLTPRKDPTSAGGIKKEEVLTAFESIKVKS